MGQCRVTSPRSSACFCQLLITYDSACLACLGESITTAWERSGHTVPRRRGPGRPLLIAAFKCFAAEI